LSEERRLALVSELGRARAAVKAARRAGLSLVEPGQAVDRAKVDRGERGTVWWADGAPDFNRHLANNTPYAEWFEGLHSGQT
jgi:hypothetical protein